MERLARGASDRRRMRGPEAWWGRGVDEERGCGVGCEGEERDDVSAPENSGGAPAPVRRLRRRGRGLLVGVKEPTRSGSFADSRGCTGALLCVNTEASIEGRRGRERGSEPMVAEDAARTRLCRADEEPRFALGSPTADVDCVRVCPEARLGNDIAIFSLTSCCRVRSCGITSGAWVVSLRVEEEWACALTPGVGTMSPVSGGFGEDSEVTMRRAGLLLLRSPADLEDCSAKERRKACIVSMARAIRHEFYIKLTKCK